MTRNKHKQRGNHVPTIIIKDLNYVESVGVESTKDSSPRYDFVSNLPPFLHNCEEFAGIQSDLKAMMSHKKTPDSNYKQPLPNLEHVCWDGCLAWIQRYYKDIPYLKMHLK